MVLISKVDSIIILGLNQTKVAGYHILLTEMLFLLKDIKSMTLEENIWHEWVIGD